ncbi:MAG: lamin tail domain-containing protein [Bacteroidales bacterium]|jgi:hypothetical protein
MKNYYAFLLTAILPGYWMIAAGQTTPKQGEVLITEIMVNPNAVSDANGEWLEVWNSTDYDLLLNGLVLKDAGSNEHIITSADKLVFPAKTYWVLSKNGDILTNGGVSANYEYQNFTLSNTSDQVIITGPDGLLIDQVSYDSGWPVIPGASMELHPDFQNFSGNDLPEHWFPARIVFGAGDKGSPGRANPFTSGLEEWEQDIRLTVFPNPANGPFILEAIFTRPQSGEIRMINLLGQDFFYKSFSGQLFLKEIMEPGFLAPGLWFLEVITEGRTKIARLVIGK